MVEVQDGTARALTETMLFKTTFLNKTKMKLKHARRFFSYNLQREVCCSEFCLRSLESRFTLASNHEGIFMTYILAHQKSCWQFQKQLENLICEVYSYFAHSSKRKAEFKELQEYAECPKNFRLKPRQTRWLSLQNEVRKLNQQLNPLYLYFAKEVDRNSKATTD